MWPSQRLDILFSKEVQIARRLLLPGMSFTEGEGRIEVGLMDSIR